jgi:hypothetical protein
MCHGLMFAMHFGSILGFLQEDLGRPRLAADRRAGASAPRFAGRIATIMRIETPAERGRWRACRGVMTRRGDNTRRKFYVERRLPGGAASAEGHSEGGHCEAGCGARSGAKRKRLPSCSTSVSVSESSRQITVGQEAPTGNASPLVFGISGE